MMRIDLVYIYCRKREEGSPERPGRTMNGMVPITPIAGSVS